MSKSFQFPLQKVLDLREIIEDSRAIVLKRSQAKLLQEKEELENLKEKKNTMLNQEQNNGPTNGSFSLRNIRISMDYISQLNDTISHQIRRVRHTNEIVAKDRNVLIEASKNKKIVEKLRERKLEDFNKDRRKKEINKENEIAIRITARNDWAGSK